MSSSSPFSAVGPFGNDDRWNQASIRRALRTVAAYDLDVRLVCYSTPPNAVKQLPKEFQ